MRPQILQELFHDSDAASDESLAEVVGLLEKKVSSSMQVDGCRKGTVMYLVEWAGVDRQGASWEPSWEPACNVNDAAIADFNTK